MCIDFVPALQLLRLRLLPNTEMNTTNSSSICDGHTLTSPPSPNACAFPLLHGNSSAAIQSCCGGAPLVSFTFEGQNCFQYCNVSQAMESSAVEACLLAVPGVNLAICSSTNTSNATTSQTAQSTTQTTSPPTHSASSTSQSAHSASVPGNLLLLLVAMSVFDKYFSL